MRLDKYKVNKRKDVTMSINDFIFDVLGDMADPKAFRVLGNKVIVWHSGLIYVPAEQLLQEWKDAKKGTDFEEYELLFPKAV